VVWRDSIAGVGRESEQWARESSETPVPTPDPVGDLAAGQLAVRALVDAECSALVACAFVGASVREPYASGPRTCDARE
jgi:hypothetical protein